ncbi:MAG: DUF2935 domain-containing protein [Eubacteriales bacterium]
MYRDDYAVKSLELHLFFGRIMKEHALFLRAGFTPADPSYSSRAENYKKEFESLLSDAVMLGNGVIGSDVLNSGELVTEYTPLAEKQTEAFTGIPINQNITARELRMSADGYGKNIGAETVRRTRQLNQRALKLLNGLISFKEEMLKNVLGCKMFTGNYPLLIEHIIREAKLYRQYVEILEREGRLSDESIRDTECFWNRIMMEHALFIRGLLDPSEVDLISTADGFAKDYSKLLEACNDAQMRTMTSDSLSETVKFRDFKTAGTQGITGCKIRSVILPLLADHVLREANHYIRLLTVR